jgi:hypothetical protein
MSSVVALLDRVRLEETHRTGGRGTQPRQTELAREIAVEIRAKVGRDRVVDSNIDPALEANCSESWLPLPGLNSYFDAPVRTTRTYGFLHHSEHWLKRLSSVELDVAIPRQENQQLASGVLWAFDRGLGHVTAANCVQRGRSLELTMKSMVCSLTECLEGIRNPRKLLKTWSGRPDSNRRRPAWEVGQRFVFSNITAHGVDSGYEKRQQNDSSFPGLP